MSRKACLIGAGVLGVLLLLSLLLTLSGRGKNVLREKVALVEIEGVLGVDIDARSVIDELKDYREDDSIKAVILRVDSPGGAVAPSQEIYEELKKLGKEKPLVASMGTLAASGGYYVSVAARKILANPGTLTGSIGVIMEIPNVKGLMDKVGIQANVVKSGRHKDIASAFRPMSDEERAILQVLLDDVHDQFIEAVAEGRGMPKEDVVRIADGRVFTGRQAREMGLVDKIGTLSDAIDEAASLAGIEGEPEVVTRKEEASLMDLLRGDVEGFFRGVLFGRGSLAAPRLQFLFSP